MKARKSNGRRTQQKAPRKSEDRTVWPQGPAVKSINLALQGGGAHGAFTWGVLDRILDDEDIEIEGISGTSAGAVNGAVLAYGLTLGGRAEAKRALAELWRRISALAALSPLQPSAFDRMLGVGRMDFSPGYWMLEFLSRVSSPYQYNALDISPLREVLAGLVDFSVLRRCDAVKVFVSATNVMRGRIKIFDISELELDALLASTCLPFLNQAVEIDGEFYWDGGYMGNPAIFPLIYNCQTPDVVLVQINPVNIGKVPDTAQEIIDRLNILTFNSGLMREMRAIEFVSRLLDEGYDAGGRLKRMLMHVIEDEEAMRGFGVSSKLNADWAFLEHLHNLGYATADDWLDKNRAAIGKSGTVDLRAMYL